MVVWQAQRVRSAVCKPRTRRAVPTERMRLGAGVCARSEAGAVRQGSSLPRGVVLKFMGHHCRPYHASVVLDGLRCAQPDGGAVSAPEGCAKRSLIYY